MTTNPDMRLLGIANLVGVVLDAVVAIFLARYGLQGIAVATIAASLNAAAAYACLSSEDDQ